MENNEFVRAYMNMAERREPQSKHKRIKLNGYLEDFALTREESDNMIMEARKIVFGD